MSEYCVVVPVAGAMNINVEADSEEEAIEKAMNASWSAKVKSDDKDISMDFLELDLYEKLSEGNVSYAPYNEIEVIKEDED